jgi:hypothetical protein
MRINNNENVNGEIAQRNVSTCQDDTDHDSQDDRQLTTIAGRPLKISERTDIHSSERLQLLAVQQALSSSGNYLPAVSTQMTVYKTRHTKIIPGKACGASLQLYSVLK